MKEGDRLPAVALPTRDGRVKLRDPARAATVLLFPPTAGAAETDGMESLDLSRVASRSEWLPDASEVVEVVRFIATQCPECGVPDTPTRGSWGPAAG